jgi:hypothetical protein
MHHLLHQRYPELFPDTEEGRFEAIETAKHIKEQLGHVA